MTCILKKNCLQGSFGLFSKISRNNKIHETGFGSLFSKKGLTLCASALQVRSENINLLPEQ